MIRVGTGGWQRPRGDLFPSNVPVKKEMLYYSSKFPMTELNTSFYGIPKKSSFEGWAAEAPKGFLFAIKVPKYLTHDNKMMDNPSQGEFGFSVEGTIDTLLANAQPLGDRLGPLLFQLPPTFSIDLARLKNVISLCPEHVRVAWDFRSASWFCPAVYELLRAAGHACVGYQHPHLPSRETDEMLSCADWAYFRFHGPDPELELHKSSYPEKDLAEWADKIADWHKKPCKDGTPRRDVYIAFQNDPFPGDALTLMRLLAERGCTMFAPPGKFETSKNITSFFTKAEKKPVDEYDYNDEDAHPPARAVTKTETKAKAKADDDEVVVVEDDADEPAAVSQAPSVRSVTSTESAIKTAHAAVGGGTKRPAPGPSSSSPPKKATAASKNSAAAVGTASILNFFKKA